MNKIIFVAFIVIAMTVLVSAKTMRPKFTMENICRDNTCTEKCQGNGYVSGHCKAGDMVEFCICGDCVAEKCNTSCVKDSLKGLCQKITDGKCECN